VTIAEGNSETVNLQLRPETAPGAIPPPPPTAPLPPPEAVPPKVGVSAPERPAGDEATPGWTTQKITGVALMGASAVGGVLGAVFTVQAHSKEAALDALCPSRVNCSDSLAPNLSSYHSVSNAALASFLVGGAFLGTGVVVYVTAPKAKAPSHAYLTPRVGVSYLGLEGAF
jgi:hypothetical protein